MIGFALSVPIVSLAGVAYPAWASFKALRTPQPDDDKQWLMYWIIFAVFHAFEFWLDALVSWLPFYYEFKLAFLVWLQFPQTMGALVLYSQVLEPVLVRHEDRIDQVLLELARLAAYHIARLPAYVIGAVAALKSHVGSKSHSA